MDCVVHGDAKSRTRLSHFRFHLLEQRMCNTYDLAIEKHVCVHPKICRGMQDMQRNAYSINMHQNLNSVAILMFLNYGTVK